MEHYELKELIGSGAFGTIYKAVDLQTQEVCAIKIEKGTVEQPMLHYELHMYRNIGEGEGIPKIFGSFEHSSGDLNMVMEYCGESLETLFQRCNRKLSLNTVNTLAIQMLHRIEFLHTKGFLHRDIKPDNFTVHTKTLYILDFGMCKRYRDPFTGEHIPYKEDKHITGTPRYASINSHLGIEMSRRDDLESLAYCLLYFLRGSLPWMQIKASSKRSKYQKIMEKKLATPIDLLCHGYPHLYEFLVYVRSLRFMDKPDYKALRKYFEPVVDEPWDWETVLPPVKEEDAEDPEPGPSL